MNRFVSNRKWLVFCLCVTFVLFTNVQCTTLTKESDNAALIYYQALLFWPKPNPYNKAILSKAREMAWGTDDVGSILSKIIAPSPDLDVTMLVLDDVAKGADPNENVKKYLAMSSSRTAIELVKEAAELPVCDWGPLYPNRYISTQLGVSLQRFSPFIQVYAHNLAAEGNFRSALEISIALQRMAYHIGGDTYFMFGVSRMVNLRAFNSIRYVLSSMPADTETLTWLKGQLIPSNVSPSLCLGILKSDFNLSLQYIRDNQEAPLSSLPLEDIPDQVEDEKAREEILKRAIEVHNKDMESALRILNSNLAYTLKYEDIQKLTNDSRIQSCYQLMVKDTARFNALTVALEIYLIKARTGSIPKVLPDNLAKDPFSDTDFEYKVTDEGFALRYSHGPWPEGKSRWLEFKVRK